MFSKGKIQSFFWYIFPSTFADSDRGYTCSESSWQTRQEASWAPSILHCTEWRKLFCSNMSNWLPFAPLLAEEISPTRIVISESMPHSIRVSWSPTPDSVVSYQVLYGPLPGNSAKLLEVDGKHNSTVLENLMPNTTYLVTVAAIYKSGKERALSAKACTQEGE